jgi:hypothetical protein
VCLLLGKWPKITLLPKTKIVKDPKKDLRPISLTANISKVAEEFVKPAVLKVIDSNQYMYYSPMFYHYCTNQHDSSLVDNH